MDDDVPGHLLDGDPSVRWQVLRDLTGERNTQALLRAALSLLGPRQLTGAP